MAVLKCKMCGGELSFEEGASVCECEYCGSKQTLPKQDDEKKLKLFERANRLRLNCEFDKAGSVYEQIIAEFPEEAEAYWGNLLCKYGIEYVDDPKGDKVPTCHRSSFDCVLHDPDFDMVMEKADSISRAVYREQAKAIEEIRKGIIEASGKEQPYDIFICYKETDENGGRTLDSVLAQDVYEALTGKGYRVFFSRISLEDKLGTEYEPYIFAALNSAKVMLAFGTSYVNYNAVWVKNEWSRFLKLMASDKSKHLIPCYKDIDAYDMPKEFARLQAQDMGKVGAVQDLLRGIDKLTGRAEQEQKNAQTASVKETVIVQNASASGNITSLLKRGYMALEDSNWQEADGYFERVLDQDAENVKAYLGKLYVSECVPNGAALQKKRLSGLNSIGKSTFSVSFSRNILAELDRECPNGRFLQKASAERELSAIPRTYESSEREAAEVYSREENYWKNSRFYSRALQFSSGAEKQETEALRDQVLTIYRQRAIACKKTVDEQRREVQSKADTRAAAVKDKYASFYAKAILQAYEKAQQAEENAVTEAGYRAAANQYRELGDYEEAPLRAKKCLERVEEIRAAEHAKALLRSYENARQAEKNAGTAWEYWAASKKFKELGDYEDAALRAKKCMERAEKIRAAEQKKAKRKKTIAAVAVLLLAALAAVYVFAVKPAMTYAGAMRQLDVGKYEEALTAFTALGTYKDSTAQVENCVEAANNRDYQAAKVLFDSGKYEEAKKAFTVLGSYKDSKVQVENCVEAMNNRDYQAAKDLLEKKDYASAFAIFIHLKGYKDVDMLLSTDENLKASAHNIAWQPGKYVTFGRYEQDNNKSNGAEPIEWLVLARNGYKALILSKYGLDAKPYNKKWVDITWEKSTLRAWLNGEFLNTAFDGTEQARIQQTAVDNGKAQGYSGYKTNGGNDTLDKVFLLSYAEANKYLGVARDNSNNAEARVSPTAYAKVKGAYTSSSNKTVEGVHAGWWWLRSPGGNRDSASSVSDGGSLGNSYVYIDRGVVRPALWVEIY